ncbi:carboxyl transferase domain-containing protein [Streptomyces puniciscabiei]
MGDARRRGSGGKATEAQHARGRLTARERLRLLCDDGRFTGVKGCADTGRAVPAGTIHKIMDMAATAGAPIAGLCDGAGAGIQEGLIALAGYGGIFQRNVRNCEDHRADQVMTGPLRGPSGLLRGTDRLRVQAVRHLARAYPYRTAERGLPDDVIDPAETRVRFTDALAVPRTAYTALPSHKPGNQPQ